MSSETDPKLQAALQKRQQAKEALEQHNEKILGLLLPDELAKDREFAKLDRQIVALKARLHRHRMTIGRKQFSRRCHMEQVERIDGEIATCKVEDQQMVAKITDLTASLEKTTQRVTKELRDKMKKQDLP